MKNLTRKLLVLGAAALLVTGSQGALAAEGEPAQPQIAVQLNGEDLVFPDAVPQVKDSRTFLPVRAVFEAMGAKVSYEGNVITAIRDGRTVTMTIGSPEVTVTEGETVTPVAMDVAPYVDNTTWRTYVPVRFAAEAFGCSVGWDQEAYTAVIVDTGKVADEVLAGKRYTYLEKLAAYSGKYNEGIWNSQVAMSGKMTIADEDYTLDIPMAVKASGITQDGAALEMDMNMTLDMTGLLAILEQDAAQAGVPDGGASEDEVALIQSLATEGIGIQMRGDLREGSLAFVMSGPAVESLGIPAGLWFTMDLGEMYGQLGMDFDALMAVSRQFDYPALIRQTLRAMPVDSAGSGYQDLLITGQMLASLFADDSFVKSGNDYISSYSVEEGGVAAEISLTLTMKSGQVTAYAMHMGLRSGEEPSMSMALDMAVDAKDKVTGGMTMDIGGTITAEFDITGGYTKGTKAPQTQPPEGAVTMSFTELAG